MPSRTRPRSAIAPSGSIPELAEAVIAARPERAAQLAAEHFSLTETMLRELHARIGLRTVPAGRPPCQHAPASRVSESSPSVRDN